ncbi:MAG: ABC transporter ATP-binding protein [Oscillospiraceae bacterium]|nr:ABC transporter ATP-binding protein [Oscillospiraceae bacterium]
MIRCSNVTRTFTSGGTEVRALRDVSFDVSDGTLTVLKGRSGSGKTTLINLMGALDEPTSGSIWYDAVDITKLRDTGRDKLRRETIGFMFQSVALVSLMSAYENVEFGLRVAGYPRSERKERVIDCLRLVGLAPRMKHMPQELSGGEQQRVAIARAIAHRPRVIFADEPTAELDSKTALAVAGIFRELVDKEHMTIVMSTHDMSLLDIADQVIELENGIRQFA